MTQCTVKDANGTNCGLFHTFRRTKKTGGGQIIEKATHDLDAMLYLLGSLPEEVAMIAKQ
jgi:predicted dehydrogenase